MHRRALELQESTRPEHPNTLGSMNNLALALKGQGKYKASEEMQRQLAVVLDSQKNSQPPTTTMIFYGSIYCY